MSWCPLKKTAIRVQNAGVFDGNININIKSLRLSDIPLTLTLSNYIIRCAGETSPHISKRG